MSGLVKNGLSMIILIFILSSNIVIASGNVNEIGVEHNIETGFFNSPVSFNESDVNGGMWFDSFSNLDDIEEYDHISFEENGIMMNHTYYEDFESYSPGSSVIGENGWIVDTTRSFAGDRSVFTASTTGPTPMPSGQIGKIYNPDSAHSFHYSGEFNSTKGTLRCFISTDKIWYGTSNAQSVMISLMKKHASTLTSGDRLITVIIKNGGIGYQTGKSTTNFFINSGITANTWYVFDIEYDCSTEKVNVAVYDVNETLIGSVGNVDFYTASDYVECFEVVTSRDHSGVYTTSFFDNIEVNDFHQDSSAYVTSKSVKLNPGYEWSTLKINKSEPGSSSVFVDITDDQNKRITGFSYNNLSNEIDLKPLNGLDISSIRLNATFKRWGNISPVLEGWGVEWNKTDTWRDTFLTGLKINNMQNLDIDDFSVKLKNSNNMGFLETKSIAKPADYYWDTLIINSKGSDSAISINIHDSSSGAILKTIDGSVSSTINISSIDPLKYSNIYMNATINSNNPNSEIFDWSINWKRNTFPNILDVKIPNNCYRNEKATIEIAVHDNEDDSKNLTLKIEYRFNGMLNWETNFFSDFTFNHTTMKWDVYFTPSILSELGIIDIRITVTDYIGYSNESIEERSLIILNNIPTIPEIDLSPTEIYTNNDIEASVKNVSIDVEGSTLYYSYMWYLNDIEMVDYYSENLTYSEKSILSSMETKKGDIVKVLVVVTDGLNYTDPVTITKTIKNSSPIVYPTAVQNIEISEDKEMFMAFSIMDHCDDIDNDTLFFRYETTEKNVTVVILENGSVLLEPSKDWNGICSIKIFISDGEFEVNFTFNLIVNPVNDLPIINKTGALLCKEDEWYHHIFTAYDPFDHDDIKFDLNADEVISGLIFGTNYYFYDNGSFMILPSNEMVGEYVLNLTVDDGSGDLNFSLIELNIINTNDAPKIIDPGHLFCEEDLWFNYTFNYVDIDENDEITFDIDVLDKIPNLVLGENYHFTDSGNLSILPTNEMVGEYQLNLSAMDIGGFSDWIFVNITVENTNDPPMIILPGELKCHEDIWFNISFEYVDLDQNDEISFSIDATDKIPGLLTYDGFSFTSQGNFSLLPTNDMVGIYDLELRITDMNGATDTTIIQLTILNTNDEPEGVIILPSENQIIDIHNNLTFNANVNDIDGDDVIITWILDNKEGIVEIGTGNDIIYTFNEAGIFNVSCIISDGTIDKKIGTIEIEVIEMDESSERGEKNVFIPILVIILVLILLVIITIIVLISRKKNQDMNEEEIEDIENEEFDDSVQAGAINEVNENDSEENSKEDDQAYDQTAVQIDESGSPDLVDSTENNMDQVEGEPKTNPDVSRTE